MASEWFDFGNGTYALIGGSNIGVIAHEGRAVMIDAGLDRSSARKAIHAVEDMSVPLVAIALTHGHADHFGGAGWAAQRAEAPVYASPLEGVFAEQPLLEPLYLHGGAAPIEELQSKFTLARRGTERTVSLEPGDQTVAGVPVTVVELPGHAPAQVGLAYDDTLYCGDAVFPDDTLDRHPILFCVDMDAWLATLDRLPALPYARFVAGHGEPVADVTGRAEATSARLREIRALTYEALAEPRSAADALRAVADHYEVRFAAPQFFMLSLTTVHAALTSLQAGGEAEVRMEDNHVLWGRT
jgi:glyoxylase-like metal-dependent hydrolase (beta-lactamase superfamily II)